MTTGPLPRGYRQLDAAELHLVNEVKAVESEVVAELYATVRAFGGDPRQVALAKTHLQDGFSALVRAITRPADPYADALARQDPGDDD